VPYPRHQRHVLLSVLWRTRGVSFRHLSALYDFLTFFDFSGGFDVPKPKCPPDRGSSDCVTGSPAPTFSSEPDSDYESKLLQNSIVYPPTPPLEPTGYASSNITAPRLIPAKSMKSPGLATPPLTPDKVCVEGSYKDSKHPLEFLMTLFPHDGLTALPFAKSVSISAPNFGAAFNGVVLEYPGTSKTLYVDGKSAESVSLRERYLSFFSTCVCFISQIVSA
jgi:hypothetical protein